MTAINNDRNGNIYILDAGNHRVTKWIPGGTNRAIAAGGNGQGSNAIQLNNPQGMFVETNTSIIWIADTNNNRIVRWESPSTSVIVGGSYGVRSNQFYYPYGIFVDLRNSKTIYVADTYNHRIQMWLPGATDGVTVAGQTSVHGNALNQFAYPTSVTVDANGYVYVVDYSNHRVMLWIVGATSGRVVAGSDSATYGNLPNQLYYPWMVKLDQKRAIFVVDYYNSRIQKFSIISCGEFREKPR